MNERNVSGLYVKVPRNIVQGNSMKCEGLGAICACKAN